MDETLVYMGQEVTFLASSTTCRYLGVWGTPTGDMSNTKERIFKRTEEARDLLRHHPLTPEQAIDLFTSIGVGAFRYSAALVPWTEKELERLEAVWVQAYKWAWGLPRTTASDVFTLPAGMEYLRPLDKSLPTGMENGEDHPGSHLLGPTRARRIRVPLSTSHCNTGSDRTDATERRARG
jgi:hypothetical protein